MDEFRLKPHVWFKLRAYVEQESKKERTAARRATLAGLRIRYRTDNPCGEILL